MDENPATFEEWKWLNKANLKYFSKISFRLVAKMVESDNIVPDNVVSQLLTKHGTLQSNFQHRKNIDPKALVEEN